MTSGKTPAKAPKRMVVASDWSGRAVEAMKDPKTRAKTTSSEISIVEFRVSFPYFLISVFKWGFQCGTLSRTKWLANASGMAK